VKVTFWGTRGSIATPGRETQHFGGDTSCLEVMGDAKDHVLVLDAGSGIRRLGMAMSQHVTRIDVLLSHLHLDHIVGLGFFAPLFRPAVKITVWGPPSTTSLLDRLGRYLSPPLFPVRLRDVASELSLRDMPIGTTDLGGFRVSADAVIHPDPALGYRIESGGRTLAYLPDHEPALGPSFPSDLDWTSGGSIAHRADLLVHDSQYTPAEYRDRVGWGHSCFNDAVAFAELAEAKKLALFHHDPLRDDAGVESIFRAAQLLSRTVPVIAARDGTSAIV
jgi:phosphoribosyl 1,2-cyclic phosphodiesterase